MKKNIDGVMLTLKDPVTGRKKDVLFPIGCTFTVSAEQIPKDNIGGGASDTTFPTAVVDGDEIQLDVDIEPGKSYRVASGEDEDATVCLVEIGKEDVD